MTEQPATSPSPAAAPQAPLRVAVLVGSTRNGRFGPTAAEWLLAQARRRGDLELDVIDLAEVRLPPELIDEGDAEPEPVTALRPRIAGADAYVVVTPEYNRSFPAPLKTAIDWYYAEWMAKPVGFVSYGGVSGGQYAVAQLRQVFNEVHAATVRDCVSFANYWDEFAADGSWPRKDDGPSSAAKAMLDQLTWWGHALRNHRGARPYEV